jgi:hypothetical protein
MDCRDKTNNNDKMYNGREQQRQQYPTATPPSSAVDLRLVDRLFVVPLCCSASCSREGNVRMYVYPIECVMGIRNDEYRFSHIQ